MQFHTVAELAKNPRAINIKELNKIIHQNNFIGNQEYLNFKNENIDHSLLTATLRLLSSSIIVEDRTIFSLLRIILVKHKQFSNKYSQLIDNFEKKIQNITLKRLNSELIILAAKIAPLVLAAQTGNVSIDNNLIPDDLTIAHIKQMLERIEYLYYNFHYPMTTNSMMTSKYQGISGVMDGISESCILQIDASPMKKISSKSIREFLYFYAIIPQPQQAKIKQMAIYNPRWDIMSHAQVGNIDQELLKTVRHKISSWDQLAGMSLMDRLRK